MHIRNMRTVLLVASAAALAGCGKQERSEAAALAKALGAAKAEITAADALENDLVANGKGWCAAITGYGGGRANELDQNATVAAELSKSAMAASSRISQVRQLIDPVSLSGDFTRGVRNTLVNQLTRRQRTLQDVRALLDDAAAQFRQYRQSRAYAGDTYPDAISKLDALFGAHKAPEDAVGAALAALQEKYKFAGNGI